MYSCGLGGNDGRLGQPDNSSKTCYTPTAILKWNEDPVCPIKQIAVGRFHCLAITGFLSSTSFLPLTPSRRHQLEKEQLIAYGYNVRHLLDGQRGDIFLPTLIPNMTSIRVKQVATATHHHLVVTGNYLLLILNNVLFLFLFFLFWKLTRTPQFCLADGTVYAQGILTARGRKII